MSLYRALDKKLYLLIFGKPFGATSDKTVWHFFEKNRFFFRCTVVAATKYKISNCEDFMWVTKDELLAFFPEHAEFFNNTIIS
ncbi:hypothetical protein HID58_058048 [Brassica napus]|uniref:Nudix hydrolase domain-containing protein n=1 Tax=Brassica napus TaxID=3708 RepID=A0ABQ7ZNX4_BRANA|nr:hypothetical protein HID58_058048 [Brassica napus]